jgi:hypothetical protein
MNATAPRITMQDIEDNIFEEYYILGSDHISNKECVQYAPQLDLMTFCVLILRNGFAVTGESHCISKQNFNAEIGRKVARDNAIEKIWPLMGYALKEQIISCILR